MKNVLVLGTGFISKNVLEQSNYLENDINKIISVSREENFLFSDHHIKSELSDIETINSILIEEKINTIYFFIGPSFPSISFDYIINDIKSCLVPFIELLQLAAQNSIKEIVMMGSAGTVYGSESKNKFQEDEIIMQENAYGALLKTMENYLILYSKKFDIKYKILRLSNVFGIYHENPVNGIINIAIRKTLQNKPISIFSKASKNYIYSKDVGKIFWLLNKIKEFNFTVNVSSTYDLTVSNICTKIKKALPNLDVIDQLENAGYDTTPPKINNLKLNALIKYQFTSLQIAINETVAWEKTKLK